MFIVFPYEYVDLLFHSKSHDALLLNTIVELKKNVALEFELVFDILYWIMRQNYFKDGSKNFQAFFINVILETPPMKTETKF